MPRQYEKTHSRTVRATVDIPAHRFVNRNGGLGGIGVLGVSESAARAGDDVALITNYSAIVEAAVPIAVGDIVDTDTLGRATVANKVGTGLGIAESSASAGTLFEMRCQLQGGGLPRIHPPEGFNRWDFEKYPVAIYRQGGLVSTDFDPREWVDKRCWSATVYHVDPLLGADANSGLGAYIDDYSQAKKSLRGAQLAANAAGVPARIRIKYRAGVISNRSDGGGAMYVAPTVPTVIEGVGGRPVFGVWDNLAWSVHSGTTYKAARSGAGRAIDILTIDHAAIQAGRAPDVTAFTKLADAAAVVASAGNTWAQVGSDVYVKRADGAAVSNVNTGIGLLAPEIGFDTAAVGGCGIWNLAVIGGGNASFGVRNTTAARDDRVFVFVGCVASRSSIGTNAFRLDGSPGLIAMVDCDVSGAGSDAYNQHWNIPDEASRMHVLRINCGSRENGSPSGQSQNSFTGHEDTFEIGVNDRGGRSFGAEAAYIDDSQYWGINPEILDPRGDVVIGGSFVPTAVFTAGTAQVWLDGGCVSSSDRAFRASGTSRINKRGITVLAGVTSTDAGAAVLDF